MPTYTAMLGACGTPCQLKTKNKRIGMNQPAELIDDIAVRLRVGRCDNCITRTSVYACPWFTG